MKLTIEVDVETDGRFIADVIEFPGVLAYGETWLDACQKATELVMNVISARVDCGQVFDLEEIEIQCVDVSGTIDS